MKHTKDTKTISRICNQCGRVIEEEYEYIRTRRGTEMYFHKSCIKRGRVHETG